MFSRLSQRLVRLPPVVLTLLMFLPLIAELLARAGVAVGPVIRVAILSVAIGGMCAWLWAVYRVSRSGSGTDIRPFWDWVFVLPFGISLVAGLASWSMNNSSASAVFFLSLFVCLTLAAKALVNANAAKSEASVGRMLVTALLMYLAPLGVWVLRSNILRVASITAPNDAR